MDKPAARAMMHYQVVSTHPHHPTLYINLVLFHPMASTVYPIVPQFDVTVITDM